MVFGIDLDVRKRDKKFFQSLYNLDPRAAHYINHAGFRGVRVAGYHTVDHRLITALVKRWRQETHTFHLSVMDKSIITLQDVEILWGLRVDGRPVTLNHNR